MNNLKNNNKNTAASMKPAAQDFAAFTKQLEIALQQEVNRRSSRLTKTESLITNYPYRERCQSITEDNHR